MEFRLILLMVVVWMLYMEFRKRKGAKNKELKSDPEGGRKERNCQKVWSLIFNVSFLAVGLVICGCWFYMSYHHSSFRQTRGSVLSYELRNVSSIKRNLFSSGKEHRTEVRIACSYRVGGKTFEHYETIDEEDYKGSAQSVIVYYNPEDPQEAVLKRITMEKWIWALLMLVPMWLTYESAKDLKRM